MVNIDALLSEWAYRCKKGYPDMDSPSDLKVLKNILKEQKISLPEFYADGRVVGDDSEYNPETDRGDSKDTRTDLDKEIEAFSDEAEKEGLTICKDANEERLIKIYRKLKANGVIKDDRSFEVFLNRCDAYGVYDPVMALLGGNPLIKGDKGKGFSEAIIDKYSAEIRDLTAKRDISETDRDKFIDYIKNPNKQATFPTNQIKGNLETLMVKAGIPKSIVSKLIAHTTQDDGKKGVGMGELALAIVFKNIKDAPGAGDLNLNGEDFEIKGQGATLGDKPEAHRAKPETVKAFETYGLKRVRIEGKTGQVLTVGDKTYKLNQFTLALADAYNLTDDKEGLKALVRKMLVDDGKLVPEAVDHVFDGIDFTNSKSIQQGASGAHFYNYVLKSKDGSPNFNHFLMHDKGEKTRQPTKSRPTKQKYVVGTGEYIYVSGTPGEMTDALIAADALYQGVTFNNMRPRVGFGSGFLE